jgi:hypothetical protein
MIIRAEMPYSITPDFILTDEDIKVIDEFKTHPILVEQFDLSNFQLWYNIDLFYVFKSIFGAETMHQIYDSVVKWLNEQINFAVPELTEAIVKVLLVPSFISKNYASSLDRRRRMFSMTKRHDLAIKDRHVLYYYLDAQQIKTTRNYIYDKNVLTYLNDAPGQLVYHVYSFSTSQNENYLNHMRNTMKDWNLNTPEQIKNYCQCVLNGLPELEQKKIAQNNPQTANEFSWMEYKESSFFWICFDDTHKRCYIPIARNVTNELCLADVPAAAVSRLYYTVR